MKSSIIFFIFSFLVVFNLNAQDNIDKTDTVEVIKDFKNLYRYQNFYLSGQPTLEALRWFKSQGVTKIINLRSEKENKGYTEYAYNEKINVQELGSEYQAIPIDGTKDYTPEKLEIFLSLINKNEKILIHCASAGRVTHFFMAYLIKNKGYTVNEAVELGKSLKFSLPLEKLLDSEISMEIEEMQND